MLLLPNFKTDSESHSGCKASLLLNNSNRDARPLLRVKVPPW
jgi:hypothetical protein